MVARLAGLVGRAHGEVRILEVGARHRAQVRAPGGEDRVHVIDPLNRSHGHDRQLGLVADALREGDLVHAAVDRA